MEKKYDHVTGDAKSQQKWAKEQTYKAQQSSEKQLFSIVFNILRHLDGQGGAFIVASEINDATCLFVENG